MGRIGLAFRAFFGVLFGAATADAVRSALKGPAGSSNAPDSPSIRSGEQAGVITGEKAAKTGVAPRPTLGRSRRSDAVSLLSALQREARFVDLVQEPLTQYSDAQIGAAARDVLRDCQRVLDRMFSLKAVSEATENSPIETPESLQDGRWRVSGKVQGEPPFRGRLVHHGWEATRCEIPQWNGADEAALVIAPAEVECSA